MTDYSINDFAPQYSAYDLAQDLKNGDKNEFIYSDELFMVKGNGFKYTITQFSTGFKAVCNGGMNNLIDFQGVAGCLIEYKKDLNFDRQGNLI
jgi:hypothetical protein